MPQKVRISFDRPQRDSNDARKLSGQSSGNLLKSKSDVQIKKKSEVAKRASRKSKGIRPRPDITVIHLPTIESYSKNITFP
jgi:hypothetical protein